MLVIFSFTEFGHILFQSHLMIFVSLKFSPFLQGSGNVDALFVVNVKFNINNVIYDVKIEQFYLLTLTDSFKNIHIEALQYPCRIY